ncbi:HNH endonuclease [Brevundimonas sp.]|uniref:HNH endonuclease n=1 Tax=Brevundimonas sp. TaxID=1871086 RepID=UPI003459F7D3
MVSAGGAVVQIQGSPAETYLSEVQPLRKFMQEDDLLLIEPSVSSSRHFRITRVAQDSPRFALLNPQAVGGAGLLKSAVQPPSDVDLVNATSELNARLTQPFELFDAGAVWLPTGRRIARSRAFVAKVIDAYDSRCAFCGLGARLVSGRSEVQAAHIVSRGKMGADDVRNGLALCRVHHWAFDEGEIRVDADLTIRVNPKVAATPENGPLWAVDGTNLKLPLDPKLHPNAEALGWHRASIAFA